MQDLDVRQALRNDTAWLRSRYDQVIYTANTSDQSESEYRA